MQAAATAETALLDMSSQPIELPDMSEGNATATGSLREAGNALSGQAALETIAATGIAMMNKQGAGAQAQMQSSVKEPAARAQLDAALTRYAAAKLHSSELHNTAASPPEEVAGAEAALKNATEQLHHVFLNCSIESTSAQVAYTGIWATYRGAQKQQRHYAALVQQYALWSQSVTPGMMIPAGTATIAASSEVGKLLGKPVQVRVTGHLNLMQGSYAINASLDEPQIAQGAILGNAMNFSDKVSLSFQQVDFEYLGSTLHKYSRIGVSSAALIVSRSLPAMPLYTNIHGKFTPNQALHMTGSVWLEFGGHPMRLVVGVEAPHLAGNTARRPHIAAVAVLPRGLNLRHLPGMVRASNVISLPLLTDTEVSVSNFQGKLPLAEP